MRLSALFGEPDYRKLLGRMPADVYQEWKLLDEVEGIGWKRDDRRHARALLWYLTSQGVKDIREEDLMFEYDRVPLKPTNESSKQTVFEAFGLPVPSGKKKQQKKKRR